MRSPMLKEVPKERIVRQVMGDVNEIFDRNENGDCPEKFRLRMN